MASRKQSKVKGKQYTMREIIMVIALAGVALIYFYSNYFLFPVLTEIDQLKADIDLLRIEYTQRKTLIAQEENLQEDFALYNREITTIKSQYFKTTNQEHFIKVLEQELIDDKDLDVLSLNFDPSTPSIEFVNEDNEGVLNDGAPNENVPNDSASNEKIPNVQIESSYTTFPFSGPYESIMSLLYRLERYTNLIRVNFLDMSYLDPTKSAENLVEPLYQGNIGIEFFTIPQEYESPWYTELPDYDNAIAFNSGLFRYDDGELGIPPFLVEKAPEVIVNEGGVTTPIVGGTTTGTGTGATPPTGTGTGTTPPTDTDEEDDPIVNPDVKNTSTYLVKPGDTIYSISKQFYGSTAKVEEIMILNEITDASSLKSGTYIEIPLLTK